MPAPGDVVSPEELAASLLASHAPMAAAFDLGGVLLTGGVMTADTEERGFEQLHRDLGLPIDSTRRLWHELQGPSEEGRMEESVVWEQLASLGHGVDPAAIRSALLDMVSDIPRGIDLLRRLSAAGWRTALATNHLVSWIDEWQARYAWFAEFSTIVCSSQIGIRKPAPGFYEEVYRALAFGEPWFFDDRLENVHAAMASGFRTAWVQEKSLWLIDPS